jgi:hypothetical protein
VAKRPGLGEAGEDAGARAVACVSVASSADPLCSPLPLGRSEREARKKWKGEQYEHHGLYVLREFLRSHFDERGLKRLHGSCLRYYWQYRHSETGATKLCPGCCHERAICPHCAVNYGKERGAEVGSLFQALFEQGRLLGAVPTVKAFADVFTLPEFVSEALDGFCEARDKKSLRGAVKELTEALKRTLTRFYGSGVAAKVSWHWWHSSKPLTGAHWHAHVMVPNIVDTGAGHEVLRARGMLSTEQLQALKALWAEQVSSCRFVAALGESVPAELTVNHRFLTQNKGRASLAHRARYDYRHPMQDFVAFTEKHGLPELDAPGLAWFLDRCEFLQGVQLVRAVGWLSNPKLKKIGLERAEPENDGWVKDEGVVFELEYFDDHGARFVAFYPLLGRSASRWFPREAVQLLARPKPRSYRWAG